MEIILNMLNYLLYNNNIYISIYINMIVITFHYLVKFSGL